MLPPKQREVNENSSLVHTSGTGSCRLPNLMLTGLPLRRRDRPPSMGLPSRVEKLTMAYSYNAGDAIVKAVFEFTRPRKERAQ
jgi:hypothetical protein